MTADPSPIRVDQVGYLPGTRKVAVVLEEALATNDGEPTFEVRERWSGTVEHSGRLSRPIEDANANQTVRHADFSDVEDAGEYVLTVGSEMSHRFEIGEDVYDDALASVGRLFTLKRTNQRIEDPVTGLEYGPGHPQDATATVTATDDPVYEEGEVADVAGGWYDAGDFGKYVPSSAISVGAKLWAYERNPDAFAIGQYEFPPGISESDRGRMPDVLAECKWKLEWLEKMQRRDGASWVKVAGAEWPEFVGPNEDTQDRHVFGLSSAVTAMTCANFAQAARVYEAHDPAFAERMLENAEAAFAWLADNPELVWREDPLQDAGSGPYGRGEDFEDPDRFDGADLERFDRFWAAAELLNTTDESRYDDYLQSELGDVFSVRPPDFDWYCGLPLGMYAYYDADAADEARREQLRTAFVDWADDRLAHVRQDGYLNALERRDYHWASVQKGATYGVLFLLADEMADEAAYVEAALEQLHHVFGRSATDYCYVTGFGQRSPEHPHDRIVDSTGVYLPGMVVGGPNAEHVWSLDGLVAEDVPFDDPGPAQMYRDAQPFYETNEWAINYSAPVFWLLAEAVATDSRTADCRETTASVPEEV